MTMTRSDSGASRTITTVVTPPACPKKVALVLGVTGLVGSELAAALLLRRTGWLVYGVARNQPDNDRPMLSSSFQDGEGYSFVACDLLDAEETARKLSPLSRDVTHVFWVTWSSRFPLDTPECYAENTAMMANVLDAILPSARVLSHIALQTGVKHYVSPLRPPSREGRNGGAGSGECCSYDEDSPRVSAEEGGRHNFYYALEDMLEERLAAVATEKPGRCISWSVHRPGLLLGSTRRACFNFVGSLCVYGAVCRRLGLPFVFGGEKGCWEEPYLDISDARVVAEQQIWASTRSTHEKLEKRRADGGEAFNAVTGPRFAWREVWPALAVKFVGATKGRQLQDAGEDCVDGLFSASFTYESFMADKGAVWEEVVAAEGLRRTRAEELACWPFLDSVFRCPVTMLVRRPGRADALGFDGGRAACGGDGGGALESILYWVDRMRADRLVP